MKKLLLSLIICLGLTGCAEGVVYADPIYSPGPVIACVNGFGVVYYRDARFGCGPVIIPYGYWYGGVHYYGYPGHYYGGSGGSFHGHR